MEMTQLYLRALEMGDAAMAWIKEIEKLKADQEKLKADQEKFKFGQEKEKTKRALLKQNTVQQSSSVGTVKAGEFYNSLSIAKEKMFDHWGFSPYESINPLCSTPEKFVNEDAVSDFMMDSLSKLPWQYCIANTSGTAFLSRRKPDISVFRTVIQAEANNNNQNKGPLEGYSFAFVKKGWTEEQQTVWSQGGKVGKNEKSFYNFLICDEERAIPTKKISKALANDIPILTREWFWKVAKGAIKLSDFQGHLVYQSQTGKVLLSPNKCVKSPTYIGSAQYPDLTPIDVVVVGELKNVAIDNPTCKGQILDACLKALKTDPKRTVVYAFLTNCHEYLFFACRRESKQKIIYEESVLYNRATGSANLLALLSALPTKLGCAPPFGVDGVKATTLDFLGKGATSYCYSVRLPGDEIAVWKIVENSAIEVEMLKRLEHVKRIPKLLYHNNSNIVMQPVGIPLAAPHITKRFVHCFVETVQSVHQYGVVHRDIRPANVLVVERSDQSTQPLLIDFGYAVGVTTVPIEYQGTSSTFASRAIQDILKSGYKPLHVPSFVDDLCSVGLTCCAVAFRQANPTPFVSDEIEKLITLTNLKDYSAFAESLWKFIKTGLLATEQEQEIKV